MRNNIVFFAVESNSVPLCGIVTSERRKHCII